MAAAVDYYRPRSTKLVNGDLPDHSALEQLFARRLSARRTADSNVGFISSPSRQKRPASQNDNDHKSLERQMAELDQHRLTVQQMSNKILELHRKMSELERQNADLRRQLDSQLYAAKISTDTEDPRNLEPAELARRYGIVKSKLERQVVVLKEYKDKVVELQKKLIEKNEQEKEYIKMQESYESQNELLRKLQAKTDRANNLEQVYKKQEQVIKKLERLINSKHRDESYDQRANDILREENRLLRNQLDNIMSLQRPNVQSANNKRRATSTEPPPPKVDGNKPRTDQVDEELTTLRQKQQAAQQRIESLERQLQENARRWSRERTDYKLRLQEAEYGLQRPSALTRRLTPLPELNVELKQHQPGVPSTSWN